MDNKNENKEKNPIADFLSTPRGVALLKLIGFFVFFFLLIFIMKLIESKVDKNNIYDRKSSSSSSSKEVSSYEFSFGQIKQELLTKNYSFSSEIKINDQEYTIIGIRNKDEYNGTYVKNNGDGISYAITKSDIFEFNNGKFVSNPDLFNDINFNNIDVKYLINLSNSLDPIIEDSTKSKIYTFTLEDYKIHFLVEKKILQVTVEYIDLGDGNSFTYVTHLTY